MRNGLIPVACVGLCVLSCAQTQEQAGPADTQSTMTGDQFLGTTNTGGSSTVASTGGGSTDVANGGAASGTDATALPGSSVEASGQTDSTVGTVEMMAAGAGGLGNTMANLGGMGTGGMATGGMGVDGLAVGGTATGGTATGGMATGGMATAGAGTAMGDAGATSIGGAMGQAGAGADGGTGCDNPALILCEDFEATNDGATPEGWTKSGDVGVASDEAHGGTHSLKIGAANNGARRINRDAGDFGSAHWGRVYYKVQTPVPDPFVHSTLVALQGDGPNIGSAEYRVVDTVKDANGTHQFLYNVQPSGGEFGTGSSYDWRFDGEWHCAEWRIDGDQQAYQFFFDGEEVTQIAIDNGPGNYGSGGRRSEIPTSFDQIRVGWNNYQSAAPGFVAWFDDLAISAERVGCE